MRFLPILAILLTGCGSVSVPVRHSLADPPQLLTERCPELRLLPEDETRLSEFLKIVTFNYTTYHECATKQELLVKWYKEQKEIHDSVFNKK